MDFHIFNPSTNRSGGVLLLWRREISIQQIFSHPKYIDIKVIEGPNNFLRLTGIYGEPRWEDRHLTWDRIKTMHTQHNIPWAIIGDFNEILYSHEKEGGNQRPQNIMQAFRDVLSDCDLEDLGFCGDEFTWRRGRIHERLDLAVVNSSWRAILQNLDYARSDHRPILLDTEAQQNQIPNSPVPKDSKQNGYRTWVP
jgi:hypothetical protein